MAASFSPVTIIGTQRRVDVSLPAGVPLGELTGELVAMLGEPDDGPPRRWGLARLGGAALDPERGLADQDVPAGAMLFLRDLRLPIPPPVIDDYASTVTADVDTRPGRWSPATLQALLILTSALWVAAAGVLAGLGLPGSASDAPALAVAAAAVVVAAIAIGRPLRYPWSGLTLALAALPLWTVAGLGLAYGSGLRGLNLIAAGLAAVAVGGAGAAAAADEGVAPAVGVASASLPWALTLVACAYWGRGPVEGAAVLTVIALTGLRLLPWTAVRVSRLDGDPGLASVPARVATARGLLGALTMGTAATLAGACVLLAVQPGWWPRALAATTALATFLHGRRRRFVVEVAPLWMVGLITVATFELGLALGPAGRPEALLVTPAVLVVLGLMGRRLRAPAGARRQLERLEALATAAAGPLALGLLGLYDEAAHIAQHFI